MQIFIQGAHRRPTMNCLLINLINQLLINHLSLNHLSVKQYLIKNLIKLIIRNLRDHLHKNLTHQQLKNCFRQQQNIHHQRPLKPLVCLLFYVIRFKHHICVIICGKILRFLSIPRLTGVIST